MLKQYSTGLAMFGKVLTLTCAFLMMAVFAVAQVTVSGRVVDESGETLPGVNVLEVGTTNGTVTDFDGNYSLVVSVDAEVQFSFTGFETQSISSGLNGGSFDIILKVGAEILDEVVVTGYQIQRKRDITGAVAVVETDELSELAATSFTQKLQGRATGVTVQSSGSPGDATNVRIRGISSFGNNDPLYIVDGVPVVDKFNTGINPNDIESIQVLKDASAASIYGSRASNGVIVITTKKGKEGKTRVTYDGYVGVQNPVKGLDDILITDSRDFIQMTQDFYDNGGIDRPAYAVNDDPPTYIFPVGEDIDESTYDPISNPIMKTNQSGTNWWDELTQPGIVTEHNLGVSGGGQNGSFFFGMGYLKQEGTVIHTDFERFSVRANSEFKAGERFRFGENFTLARSNGVFAPELQDEQGVITQVIKTGPLVPVYDIMGNWGGAKAPGLSNGDNPVAVMNKQRDNRGIFYKVLGNVWGEVDILKDLTFRSSFGVDYFDNFQPAFTFPTPENNEPTLDNGFREDWSKGFTWTWTNTLTYRHTFNDRHDLTVLAGYEAIQGKFRAIGGSLSNYFITDINAWYLNVPFSLAPDSRSVYSNGSENTLVSMFGKIDYAFDDKYLVSATVRRDGSSRFSESNRYGVFPAFSVGWRISQEGFMQNVDWIDDLKIRGGWGITGNQQIANYNYADQFGSERIGQTSYDIAGTNGSTANGYALTARGNAETKWEENSSINVGFDAAMFNDKFTVVFDWYTRETTDLLYQPPLPGTAGSAAAPFINVGGMKNTGVDLGLGYRTPLGSRNVTMDLQLNLSTYTNEVTSVDGDAERFFPGGIDNRLAFPINVNQVGFPISSFNGYVVEGLFESEDELNEIDQPGAVVGGLRFKDQNGDGIINDDDWDIIGNPHPDLTIGFRAGFTFGNFDLSAFWYASIGNDIFNYNKLFTDFRQFNANASVERYENAGTGTTPALNISDQSSRNPSDYYVEDGSYLRLNQLQVGYNLPQSMMDNWGIGGIRVYLQAQNLFTITNYSGLDPALSSASNDDLGDLWNGYDFGQYPNSRVISFGINAQF